MTLNALHPSISLAARPLSDTAKPQDLARAAEQFEALFLRHMLAAMRQSTDALADEQSFLHSREARHLRDFFDDALAQELASQRSTGIAELLIRQLSPSSS
ncbi:rod-binding protein [Pantoea eucrina]|uniref:Rod-binding protein n=1 Tax=Pantoea eucrina TaxID=472693 RepID=A0ABU5LBN2_9GAMM|nr:rod-binding protein [Pantoea eucrina]MDZ7277344.1 rod-binding protein [Pantoea eucrina]